MKIAEQILEYTASNKQVHRTSKDAGHYHHYRVDGAGNGATTFTSEGADAHYHTIADNKVEASNGHTHSIQVSEEKPFPDTLTFKTKYGFEHWFNKFDTKKDPEKGRWSVRVAGKEYSSAEEAARALLRRH
jgi:hypothetical protein